MPEQGEVATKTVADLAVTLHQPEGLVAVAEAHVALGDDGAFHQDQRALAQAQRAALVQVVEPILPAGAATEAGAVGEAQGGVVVEAVVVPESRGGGRLPASDS